MIKRILATLAATATFAAVLATPAVASPEDGEGCVGTPTIPATYVCIITVDAGGVLPTVTTTPMTVTVPPVCYLAGCTAPTPVNVPIPSVSEGSGAVLVLWHQGKYYPFAVSSGGVVSTLVGAINTGRTLAEHYAGVLITLYEEESAEVQALADEYAAQILALAGQVLDDLQPLLTALRNYVNGVIGDATDPWGVACRTLGFVWTTAGGDGVNCFS